MNGPERLRLRLQEKWIRAVVREELVQVLADLAGAALNADPDTGGELAVIRAAETAIEKIKERTEHERGRNGL